MPQNLFHSDDAIKLHEWQIEFYSSGPDFVMHNSQAYKPGRQLCLPLEHLGNFIYEGVLK